MSKLTSVKLAGLALLVSAIGVLPAATSAGASQPLPEQAATGAVQKAASHGKIFHRTELYFGLSRPGGEVKEEEFLNFLDVEVTKRFPDGLTLLSGNGQWQESPGVVIKEKSKLLILFYPLTDREADREVEDIRTAYKSQFEQQSVLRVDALERVSF